MDMFDLSEIVVGGDEAVTNACSVPAVRLAVLSDPQERIYDRLRLSVLAAIQRRR